MTSFQATAWIYCVSSNEYQLDDIYKLGYIAMAKSENQVKSNLLNKFERLWSNSICLTLFPVRNANEAEAHLFQLLKDFAQPTLGQGNIK
jgi:hypothetical protein